MSFDGTWDVDMDAGTFGYETSLDFDACSERDVTIDGSLTDTGSLEADLDGMSLSMEFTQEGTLDFSGEVEGSCTIDVTGSVTVDGTSVTTEVEGTVCGHDVEDL